MADFLRIAFSREGEATQLYSTGLPTSVKKISRSARGELSYLAPLGSENISAPYFKQCFFQGGVLPPRLSQTPLLPVPREK